MSWADAFQQAETPLVPCRRCKTETDTKHTWNINNERFTLCGSCNPAIYKLINDWLSLGWMDIPAKEFVE